MISTRITAGLIAAYLAAAPCLSLNHDNGNVPVNSASVAYEHDDSHSTHNHNTKETEKSEHCCQDLSSSTLTPLKQLPSAAIAALPVLPPSLEIPTPAISLKKGVILSRDGPLHEKANEFAKTIIIRT